jgi:hypothetical protein
MDDVPRSRRDRFVDEVVAENLKARVRRNVPRVDVGREHPAGRADLVDHPPRDAAAAGAELQD